MKKIVVFAGTTEGRIFSERLSEAGISHTVCVATEYGGLVMKPAPGTVIKTGRMDEKEMEAFFKENADLVYDATHPYAQEVTKNIKEACNTAGSEYVRIKRADIMECNDPENAPQPVNIRYFADASECAGALLEVDGNILLTTGSKEVAVYTENEKVREKIYARVLPSEESIRLCTEAGLFGKHIIAMHGPFTVMMNESLIKQFDIKCLVTKQSGTAGGYYEKLQAACNTGISVFVIGRPEEEAGITVDEALKSFGIKEPLNITLIGCGPGDKRLYTVSANDAVTEADVVFGASRLIKDIPAKQKYPYYLAKDVIPVLEQEPVKKAVMLFSGDSSFFSGAEKMRTELLKWAEEKDVKCNINIIPGISSLSYLAAKTGEAYQEYPFMSLHGRNDAQAFAKVIKAVKHNSKIFLILSGASDVQMLGESLKDEGLPDCMIILGSDLSYPEELIMTLSPNEAAGFDKKGLYCAIIKNPSPEKRKLVPFLNDEAFERGEKVPMTKEMIRHASIIRLDLSEGDVLYDVGSGTGSVSVEAALLDPSITVYAIEKNEAAVRLTEQNAKRFGCKNISIVPKEAPEAFDGLTPPTHVFIGGSGGNLKEILAAVKRTDESVKVVVNAVTLETIAETAELIKNMDVQDLCTEQLSVSKGRKLGRYNLMTAENPVMIFSFCV